MHPRIAEPKMTAESLTVGWTKIGTMNSVTDCSRLPLSRYSSHKSSTKPIQKRGHVQKRGMIYEAWIGRWRLSTLKRASAAQRDPSCDSE
jgi:hypothetical protein